MRMVSIASGSSGNCIYIGSSNGLAEINLTTTSGFSRG